MGPGTGALRRVAVTRNGYTARVHINTIAARQHESRDSNVSTAHLSVSVSATDSREHSISFVLTDRVGGLDAFRLSGMPNRGRERSTPYLTSADTTKIGFQVCEKLGGGEVRFTS